MGRISTFKILKSAFNALTGLLQEYTSIGTQKECRIAVEKQKSKKCKLSGYEDANGNTVYDTYECPNCGKMYEIEVEEYEYCPNCGQHMEIDLSLKNDRRDIKRR